MTIEGGCFTTALLKKHHISELFEEESPDKFDNENNGDEELAKNSVVVVTAQLSGMEQGIGK